MDEKTFTGKVALVTGASSGIGYAVAAALATRGAAVVGTYLSNAEGARALQDETASCPGEVDVVRADVSKLDDVNAAVAHTLDRFSGKLDILVNNAGQWMDKTPIAECSEELWDHVMDVNLKSVFLCCRAAIPTMVAQQDGAIVNITSIAGQTGGGGGTVPYGAAKAGAITLTKGLARELARNGIRVNSVAPGVIDTPMQHKHSSPEQLRRFSEQTVLRRLGTSEDVVGAVLLLVSPYAAYITGETIDVNGGLLMR